MQGEANGLINIGPKREEFCCSESCSEHLFVTEMEPDLTSAPGRNMKHGTADQTRPFPTWWNSTGFSRVVPLPGTLSHYTPVVSTDIFNNIRRIVNAARRSPAPGRRRYPTATHQLVPIWCQWSVPKMMLLHLIHIRPYLLSAKANTILTKDPDALCIKPKMVNTRCHNREGWKFAEQSILIQKRRKMK